MSLKSFILTVKDIAKKSAIPHFVNGEIVNSLGKKYDQITNPSNNELMGNIILNDKKMCNMAIKNSSSSVKEFSKSSINSRIDKLIKWNNWIVENKNELASLISEENGKTFVDAKAELDRGLEVVQYSFSAPTLLKGDYSIINDNLEIYTKKQPLGVTMGILPFNFPAMIPLWMIPLAVVTGNSIILKSSEKCPYTPLCLAYGARVSGIPDGIINVIHGDKNITNNLITDENVKAVSFVGSTEVGKKVYNLASEYGKRSQINMGAKNHAVIMPDADYTDAANSIISAFVMGQRCMAISVLILVEGSENILEYLVSGLTKVDTVKDIGPLICTESKDNIKESIDLSLQMGANVIYGDCNRVVNNNVGNYIDPVVIDNVDIDMPVYKNELFGPVLSIIRVKTLDEAIKLVNQSEYGNGTSIFTTNLSSATHYENNIDITQCGINVPIPVSPPYYSWTSGKESYRGTHYIYGPSSFEFYTQQKTIMKKHNLNSKISVAMPTN